MAIVPPIEHRSSPSLTGPQRFTHARVPPIGAPAMPVGGGNDSDSDDEAAAEALRQRLTGVKGQLDRRSHWDLNTDVFSQPMGLVHTIHSSYLSTHSITEEDAL
jgi:hypothetical protein